MPIEGLSARTIGVLAVGRTYHNAKFILMTDGARKTQVGEPKAVSVDGLKVTAPDIPTPLS